MSTIHQQTLPLKPSSRPPLAQRVRRMAFAWAGIGAVMGMGLGLEIGGVVGIVATLIGGMIEMAALGAVLTFIGGRPGNSLLGGGCGLAVGVVAGLMGGQTGLVPAAAFGLVVGALAGATLRPYLRLVSLPVVLLVRVWSSRHRRRTIGATSLGGRLHHQSLVPRRMARRKASRQSGCRAPSG